MNMFDEAQAIKGMIEMCSLTQGEIAVKMGVSQSYIANKIRLLSLAPEIKEKILDTGISERHARALLKLPDTEMQGAAIEKIIAMQLPVRATEAMIDDMLIESEARAICDNTTRDRVRSFEDMISAAVKGLISHGIRVSQDTDESHGKRYITLCIHDN